MVARCGALYRRVDRTIRCRASLGGRFDPLAPLIAYLPRNEPDRRAYVPDRAREY
jgi:hypothetical protein